MQPMTIRIIAFQVLFLGMLFLPNFSLYQVSLAGDDLSLIIGTLKEILSNPAFYGVLMLVAAIFMCSFQDYAPEDEALDEISMARLLESLNRVLTVYVSLFLASWFFLVYKKMFMGSVYINDLVLAAI